MQIPAPTPEELIAVAMSAVSSGNNPLIILGIFLVTFILGFILSKRFILSLFIAIGLALVYSLYAITQYSSNIVY